MESKFVTELDDKNWLTDLTVLVDLASHLNELDLCLQGENQLINVMFETINALEMKLKIWQSQIMSNNFMEFH